MDLNIHRCETGARLSYQVPEQTRSPRMGFQMLQDAWRAMSLQTAGTFVLEGSSTSKAMDKTLHKGSYYKQRRGLVSLYIKKVQGAVVKLIREPLGFLSLSTLPNIFHPPIYSLPQSTSTPHHHHPHCSDSACTAIASQKLRGPAELNPREPKKLTGNLWGINYKDKLKQLEVSGPLEKSEPEYQEKMQR